MDGDILFLLRDTKEVTNAYGGGRSKWEKDGLEDMTNQHGVAKQSTRQEFSIFELSKTSTSVENTGMMRIEQGTSISTSLFLKELSTQNLIMKDW